MGLFDKFNLSPSSTTDKNKNNTTTTNNYNNNDHDENDQTKDITPKTSTMTTEVPDLPDDHPVHKILPEKQAKMRSKGVDPVVKAEMDERFKGKHSHRFLGNTTHGIFTGMGSR